MKRGREKWPKTTDRRLARTRFLIFRPPSSDLRAKSERRALAPPRSNDVFSETDVAVPAQVEALPQPGFERRLWRGADPVDAVPRQPPGLPDAERARPLARRHRARLRPVLRREQGRSELELCRVGTRELVFQILFGSFRGSFG